MFSFNFLKEVTDIYKKLWLQTMPVNIIEVKAFYFLFHTLNFKYPTVTKVEEMEVKDWLSNETCEQKAN